MKNPKTEESQYNIAVIGLSGSEGDKGVQGVGKSCLCNRLAQPNLYKSKHSSVVSQIDYYGSETIDNQSIYWGSVYREIKARKYQFRFIEHTVLLEDVSHRPLMSRDKYLERATCTELRGTKQALVLGPGTVKHAPLAGKNLINLFILVYDVSFVKDRHSTIQIAIFKELIDRVILTKRPLIIVTTKHDECEVAAVTQLTALLEKRAYCKYPLVETSAKLGVNIDPIFELATILIEGGLKNLRQRAFLFSDAFAAYENRLELCRADLRKVAISILDGELWHSSWAELKDLPAVLSWVKIIGADIVKEAFEEVRIDVRIKRRIQNEQKHKENLLQLLQQLHNSLDNKSNDVTEIVDNLKTDSDFMKHFISFTKDAEYFDFNENRTKLPLYILDRNSEHNLIFVIKEYIEERTLEEQLFQRLIKDSSGNFKKSMKEVGNDLRHHMKYFISEKLIVNVYERFQRHYLKILENKFLEVIHENPNLFWSLSIFKYFDIFPEKPWKINGLPQDATQPPDPGSSSFITTMVKEINSKIKFDDFSIKEDKEHIRETWIYNYLIFLLSPNEFDCIYRQVSQCSCNNTLINDTLSETNLSLETDVASLPHVWYIVLVGDGFMKNQLTDLILSFQKTWTPETCKVHSTKYILELLSNISNVKEIIDDLKEKDDRCSSLSIFICDDNVQSSEILGITDVERINKLELDKYVIYNVEEEFVTVGPFEGLLNGDQPDADTVHISTLIFSLKRFTEPSIIWVVTVCGDNYDYSLLLNIIINVLKFHSIPKRMNSSFVTISGSFTSKEVDRHKYRLCFISYHQAIKLLIRSPSPPPIDGLLLICSLDRPASLNTCLSIKKYLRKESSSICHSMMMGVLGDQELWLQQARSKAQKHGMKYVSISLDDSKKILSNFGFEIENQLLEFFINIFKGSILTESLEDFSTNSSLINFRSEIMEDIQSNHSNPHRCKTCGQCKSNENFNNSFRISQSNYDNMLEENIYDQVLGKYNEENFHNGCPEFKFHGPQDICNKCTQIKCSIHESSESIIKYPQTFRTRMRSQSGPDLRNLSDSIKDSLNQSSSSVSYCPTCGARISHSTEGSGSGKRLDSKDSSSKKLTTILQDMFNPTKKLNDIQSHGQRKSFLRASSKKHK